MAIDRKKIIDNMSKVQVMGNEEGLISGFNVFVTQLPGRFWNSFGERLTRQVNPEMLPAAEYLLFNAARSCGYHTGYGIITSEEWKAIVAPMIEKVPEDILHGAYAVFTAWGWAKSEIVELIPGKKMVVRAYDYYESDVVEYGSSSKMNAHMIRGVSAAFMALAYGGDYQAAGGPEEKFECIQVKGIECGDEYGEFVVTPA